MKRVTKAHLVKLLAATEADRQRKKDRKSVV